MIDHTRDTIIDALEIDKEHLDTFRDELCHRVSQADEPLSKTLHWISILETSSTLEKVYLAFVFCKLLEKRRELFSFFKDMME